MNRPSGTYDLSRLCEEAKPWTLRHHAALTSTNDRARQDVEAGSLAPPAVIVAEAQTAGRGRGTNTWWSVPGSMTVTFVVSPSTGVPCPLVPLLAGLAVRRALQQISSCGEIALKWPNDLVVERRKLGGLLCERLAQADLVGVGVNVNAGSDQAPFELRDHLISLHELTRRTWDLTALLISVSREIGRILPLESEGDARDLLREYERHHWPTGREVTLIDTDGKDQLIGRCQGIDDAGRLVLRTSEGVRACLTGTIAAIGPRIAEFP